MQQEFDQIEAAKKAGIEFITLPEDDMATLRKKGDAVHEKYARKSTSCIRGTRTGRRTTWKRSRATSGTSPSQNRRRHPTLRGFAAGPSSASWIILRSGVDGISVAT